MTKDDVDYFKWLLNANANYVDASPEIRNFIEKLIWQIDAKFKDENPSLKVIK